jgi:hypothetical protein
MTEGRNRIMKRRSVQPSELVRCIHRSEPNIYISFINGRLKNRKRRFILVDLQKGTYSSHGPVPQRKEKRVYSGFLTSIALSRNKTTLYCNFNSIFFFSAMKKGKFFSDWQFAGKVGIF